MRIAAGLVVVGFVCATSFATQPVQRALTFDERVTAQTAIERVYYSHQLGATKPFEEAVPVSVIKGKVRKYLEQSAALNAYWKTSVTDQTLQRESERMAQGTRMPERLQELYAALGDDPFLVEECLARPALVDRLTNNFYAFDRVLHASERAQAEEIHRRLVAGELSPSADHPNRTVTETGLSGTPQSSGAVDPGAQTGANSHGLRKQSVEPPAVVGEVSEIKETREAFAFKVVLSQTKTSVRVANYLIKKTTWDSWWADARLTVRGDSVQAVAAGLVDLPALRARRVRTSSTTCADDYWDNGMLDDVVPDPRMQALAVWTGTQMIVWGGDVDSFYTLQTGGRYDPATDTWTPTSLTGAPEGRFAATAVWTGDELVVWGGNPYFGSRPLFNSGGRYDPVSDTWTPTSGRGAPSARYGHSAVWTGSRMVIWGGIAVRSSYPYHVDTDTGAQYDPRTDTWTPTSTIGAPSARAAHSAVWTGSLMLIWGSNYTETGGRYDPVSDRWTPTSQINAPRGRILQSAVWTGTEMVVWGGMSYILNDPNCGGSNPLGGICFVFVNTGGRYNPASDTWVATSTEDAPSARGGQTAIWTGSRMVIWGVGDRESFSNTGGRYDPATDSWSPTSLVGAPSPREFQNAVWTGSLMVIWGGYSRDPDYFRGFSVNTGARYDPASDSWTPTDASTGHAGTDQTAAWTGNLMLIWGNYSSGERYDPVTDNWTTIATTGAPPPRSGHSAVWTGTLMVVWGGGDGWTGISSGGRYEPVSDSWSPTSESGAPSGRSRHTAVWTGSSMVVWGGFSFDGTYHEFESGGRYDPATDAWTPTSEIGAPSGREQHTAIWTGNSMVVWGGGVPDIYGDFHSLNTGGRYDPTTDAWMPTSTTNAPSARVGHTAVWTGSLMIVWSGSTDYGRFGTGGRYDPATDSWTPTSTTFAPSPRFAHSAVWTGTLMVVWGGYGNYGFVNESGARYDPIADGWSRISKSGAPTARGYHVAVWTGTEMIVCGGSSVGYGYGGGGQYFPGRVADNDCDGDGVTGYAGDCDDHNPSVYPSAPQICDGVNDDCSDPFWPSLPPGVEVDEDGDGLLSCQGDCDDANASVYPGAPQICDGVNDDCNDPAWPAVPPDEADADQDGAHVCDGDCNDGDGSIGPGFVEYCDGRDNDCNGIVDDGGATADCHDNDPCSDDICGGVAGCLHPANHDPCDDRNNCTLNDVCGAGRCGGTPTPGAPCDDSNPCTSEDLCDDHGRCFGTSPCDDGDQCTRDYADPTRSCECSNIPTYGLRCDDGDACTTGEYCSDSNTGITCRYGQPVGCSDGNPCTDDICVSPGGACVHAPHDGVACSDGNPCTQSDTCRDGTCVGSTPVDCAGPCPAGSTPTDGGCSLTYDIDESSLDNLDENCGDPSASRYNDCFLAYGFHWTDAGRAIGPVIRVEVSLEPGVHCTHGPSHVTLNGLAIGDFLSSGTCSCQSSESMVALTAPSVDSYSTTSRNQVYVLSGYGCEGLSTSPDLGGHFARVTVTYRRESGPCVTSACEPSMGGCTYSPAADCDDGNPCTDDACDPSTGCTHAANTTAPVFVQQPSFGTCAMLWPPSHGYVDFTVADTGAAASSQNGIASIQFASCSSTQPENGSGTGDGNSTRDCVYEPGALHLRAERDGACSPIGRVYELRMIAVDVCGNTTTSNPFQVGVWHDRATAPTTGTVYHGSGGASTTRPGTNGIYGPGCGVGSPACGEVGQSHDGSDADPQMEISQGASISVDELHLGKATGGSVLLTWTEPAHQAAINVTRFHVYRLDPATLFWTQIAEVTKQTNSFLDPILNDGRSWQYKVTAVIK